MSEQVWASPQVMRAKGTMHAAEHYKHDSIGGIATRKKRKDVTPTVPEREGKTWKAWDNRLT